MVENAKEGGQKIKRPLIFIAMVFIFCVMTSSVSMNLSLTFQVLLGLVTQHWPTKIPLGQFYAKPERTEAAYVLCSVLKPSRGVP